MVSCCHALIQMSPWAKGRQCQMGGEQGGWRLCREPMCRPGSFVQGECPPGGEQGGPREAEVGRWAATGLAIWGWLQNTHRDQAARRLRESSGSLWSQGKSSWLKGLYSYKFIQRRARPGHHQTLGRTELLQFRNSGCNPRREQWIQLHKILCACKQARKPRTVSPAGPQAHPGTCAEQRSDLPTMTLKDGNEN